VKIVLHLNLHRQFFAAIAAGPKRIEYRRRTPYWQKRLEGRKYDVIKFRNGYQTNAPEMIVQFRGIRKRAKNYEILLGAYSENQTLETMKRLQAEIAAELDVPLPAILDKAFMEKLS
jgi:hypothetical protein